MSWFSKNILGKPTNYNVDKLTNQYASQFDDVRGQYGDISQGYGQQVDFGRGLMDFDSDYNQRLKQQFSGMAADRLGQSNQANQANAARFGGLSGVTNAQNNASGVGFTQAGMNAFNQAYGQNLGQGAGMVNAGLGGQMGATGALTGIEQGIADTRGNLSMANTDMNNQWSTGLANNVMGGLMNYATGGMSGLAQGVMGAMGGGQGGGGGPGGSTPTQFGNVGGMTTSNYNPIQANTQALWGSMNQYSDIRVKHDITAIGHYKDYPIYTFRYNASPEILEVGVMAQDVEKINPKAVKEINGIKTVNYSMILGS